MFANRRDAGRRLAELVGSRVPHRDPVILALPRGGVPVGAQVADALDAPLDLAIVRKLGCPWQPELGFGAIGEDGVTFVDPETVERLGIEEADIRDVVEREQAELERRVHLYRGDKEPLSVAGRCVVLVDDGIATGGSISAAVGVIRERGASRVVIAAPVAPRDAVVALRSIADDVLVLEEPMDLRAIGQFYEDFTQTSDDEVLGCLAR